MEHKIREYQKRDYTELLSLLDAAYNSTITQEVLEKEYISSTRSILVAVNESDHVVGCTFVEIQEDYVRPNRIAYVTYVAVDENCRRQGIGKKLLAAVEMICKIRNCSAIELTSADFRVGAHEFYKSLGYTKKATTVFIKELREF